MPEGEEQNPNPSREKPENSKNEAEMTEAEKSIAEMQNLITQIRNQCAEEYRKGKQTKTAAEVPVSQIISQLKRIICSKYKTWHVVSTDKRKKKKF